MGERPSPEIPAEWLACRCLFQDHVPQNWRPRTGTIITGAAANKAKAAALAKYPGGIVNRVLKLSDGPYAVHKISWRITSSSARTSTSPAPSGRRTRRPSALAIGLSPRGSGWPEEPVSRDGAGFR